MKLPETDVDARHICREAIIVVEDRKMETPWYKTQEFLTMLATYILGPIVLWLTSKGIILPSQSEAAIGLFSSAVIFVIGWATTQFMKVRGEVTKVRAQAAAALELNAKGISFRPAE